MPGDSGYNVPLPPREILSKAKALGVTADPAVEEDMEKVLRFYDTAAHRSDTMVKYVVTKLGVGSGGAAAMLVGAAHTARVVELLRSQKISVARIAPKALNPKKGNLTIEQFKRKNDGKFVREGVGTLGAILNSRRKPQPVIGNTTHQSAASAMMAAWIAAKGARLRKKIPDDVWEQIGTLPELRVDRGSFTQEGYDVIFRVWAKDTSGQEREVWIRAGSADKPGGAKKLEEKLLQAVADLGGGGAIPPRTPPANSEAADDEGSGDGKRGEVLINRIGTDEVAVFGRSKDQVLAVGRLSG